MGRNDFRLIPNGTGGLEDRMPVLWSAGVNTGRLTPNEFVAVTSANAARIYNMYPQKGVIQPGADADIVLWDPAATKTISAKNQVSRIEYNVFEGWERVARLGFGVDPADLQRGGAGRAARGRGRFVHRPPLPPYADALRTWKRRTAPQAVARV